MTPLYFSSNSKTLFGLYSPANQESKLTHTKKLGVVLCPPIGLEAIRSHWAYRLTADALSQAGFEVLRFDYYGTGDSEGESSAVSIDQWLADITAACDELAHLAQVDSLVLVGLRAGANFALSVAREIEHVSSLVMWDPVVSGAHTWREWQMMHDERIEALCTPNPSLHYNQQQVLGFLWPDEVSSFIQSVDLPEWLFADADEFYEDDPSKALNQLWLTTNSDELDDELLPEIQKCCDYRLVKDKGDWRNTVECGKALLPTAMIEALISHCAHQAGSAK